MADDPRRSAHGRPAAAAALARRSSASARPSSRRCCGHARHDGGAERRRPRGAADRRACCRSSFSASSTTTRYPDAEPVPYTELVNPVLTPLSDEIEEDWEGCLSVPGIARRRAALHAHLRYEGFDPAGRPIRREVDRIPCARRPARMRPPARHPVSDADARHVAVRLHRHPVPGQSRPTRNSGRAATPHGDRVQIRSCS